MVLDPVRFYHTKTVAQPIPDGSDDSDLSSEDDEPDAVISSETFVPDPLSSDSEAEGTYDSTYMRARTNTSARARYLS